MGDDDDREPRYPQVRLDRETASRVRALARREGRQIRAQIDRLLRDALDRAEASGA